MISLGSTFVNRRSMKSGDNHATDTATFSATNMLFEPVVYSYAEGTPYVFYLSKVPNEAYAEAVVDTVRTGDASATDHGRVFEIGTNDPYILTASRGGSLLTLANKWKDYFFGGVTQTISSLYNWMCENYGNAYGFRYSTITNALLFSLPLWGELVEQEVGWSKVQASRGVDFTVPEKTVMTGADYGIISIPSDVTGYEDITSYMFAALIFDPHTNRNDLQFDVYVDGTQDPNIAITWKANDTSDNFSLQLVSPMIWTLPDSQPSYPFINDGGTLIPNEANAQMRKYANTWAGSYEKPYLTEFATCTDNLDTFDKTLKYGASGIATRMRYLLRFNKQKNENNTGVMTWGNLYIVDVPREVSTAADINVTRLDPSANNPEFTDKVVVHLGTPPDDIPDADDDYPTGEDYDGTGDGVYEDDDIHDFDDGTPTGFDGKAVLTKTYAMTAAKTANVGSKLWSQSYFDVLKIQNNPIENIVAMKWFPFSVSGTQGNIKVGDVDFGLQTDVVDTMYRFTVGSAWYRPRNSRASFLDCSPYTQIKLHLPYCGIVQLDATELLNRRITVKYVVDLVSGDCIAFIYLDGNELGEKQIPYMSVEGHCGVDIPLTASNRIQAEMRAASTAISAMTGAAGHVLAGDVGGAVSEAAQGALNIAGMDFTTQRTKAHSPACMSYENRNCYLEIWRPAVDSELTSNDGFKSRHGFPCYKYKTLSELSGFVKCDARTKIDFAMTSRENEMLERLLTSGVYV